MSSSEVDKNNIITTMIEELSEEERKAYLVLEEHIKAQFLNGFKKDHGGFVKRVEEFVMPSFKLNKDMVEDTPTISTPPSNLFQKLSLMIDQKLVATQSAAGDMFAKMNSEIDALKGTKPMDGSYSSEPSSATPVFMSEPIYGIPPP